MGVAVHVWPKPLFRDGKVYDAPNQKEYNAHQQTGPDANSTTQDIPQHGYGWSPTYTHQEFPKALHGKDEDGNDISVSVKNEEEMNVALENGWSRTLLHDAPEPSKEVTLSHLAPPPGRKSKKSAKAKAGE